MNYSITVRPQDQRQAIIANEVAQSKRTSRFYEFRNEPLDLKVVRVPLDLLVYRMANFRTRVKQLSDIRQFGRAPSFFLEGEENETAQRTQHSFLWQLANDQKESITSIISTLELQGQREPLLITSLGIVVNGNRRLAAMRELFAQDGEQFQNFAYVDCQVLPANVMADEIKEIEVRLQMTPETRLPYEWVNECMAIQELYDSGKSFDDIGRLMRMDSNKVKDKFQMLAEVDSYLKDCLGADGEYERVEGAEQIISEIAKRLRKKDGTSQEVARRLSWILINKRGTEGRIYELSEVVGTFTEDLIARIQDVYPEADVAEQPDEHEGDIEFDLGALEGQSSETSLISFLKAMNGNDTFQGEVVSMSRGVIEARKLQKVSRTALKAVIDVNTKLAEISLESADRVTFDAISRHLVAIGNRVQVLSQLLARLQTAGRVDM